MITAGSLASAGGIRSEQSETNRKPATEQLLRPIVSRFVLPRRHPMRPLGEPRVDELFERDGDRKSVV